MCVCVVSKECVCVCVCVAASFGDDDGRDDWGGGRRNIKDRLPPPLPIKIQTDSSPTIPSFLWFILPSSSYSGPPREQDSPLAPASYEHHHSLLPPPLPETDLSMAPYSKYCCKCGGMLVISTKCSSCAHIECDSCT